MLPKGDFGRTENNMNVFQYVDLMKEQNSIVATVGVGLLALFLLIIIFKMLVGMRRGTWRQLIYTASTAYT